MIEGAVLTGYALLVARMAGRLGACDGVTAFANYVDFLQSVECKQVYSGAMDANEETYATITSYLVVPDADAEIRFLAAAFDAQEVLCHRNDDGTVMHAEIRIGDSLLMIGQAGGECPARTAAHYLWIADVDATYQRALAAGASSESVPEDKAYGHRCAGVVDTHGITWWLAAPIRPRD